MGSSSCCFHRRCHPNHQLRSSNRSKSKCGKAHANVSVPTKNMALLRSDHLRRRPRRPRHPLLRILRTLRTLLTFPTTTTTTTTMTIKCLSLFLQDRQQLSRRRRSRSRSKKGITPKDRCHLLPMLLLHPLRLLHHCCLVMKPARKR